MKKIIKMILLSSSIFILGSNAFGEYIDITIDPNEDGTVNPYCLNTQPWDLEGFLLEGSSLKMVGGYDFENGEWGNGLLFTSGDIFIDITGDAGNESSTNYGYEFVIDLNFEDEEYVVYDLQGVVAELDLVYYGINIESNPWQYVSGASVLTTGDLAYETDLTDAETGFVGGTHNAVTVDLSQFLSDGQSFTSHFTMECGNDEVNGEGTVSIPEPGTISLLAMGCLCMVGFWALRRKKDE